MGSGAPAADATQLGRLLKRMRIERGISAEALATMADIHPTTLSRIESGTEDPKWSTVKKILRALGVDLLADLA